MKDQELLLEAIDHYELLTPGAKALLKSLVKLQFNNEVIITIPKLTQYVGNNRQTVSNNLKLLQENNFIEADLRQGKKLKSIFIKPERLAKIVDHYLPKKTLK